MARAIVEGLALRAKLEPDVVSDDLGGRILAAIAVAWFDFDNDRQPLGHQLAEVDTRRQARGTD